MNKERKQLFAGRTISRAPLERNGVSRRDFLKYVAGGTGASLAASLLAACGGGGQPAAAPETITPTPVLEPVSLLLNRNPGAEHAPFFLGQRKGFYRRAGIYVDIRPGSDSATVVERVGASNSTFGVAASDAIIVGRSRDIPVVATAMLLQQCSTVLASFKEQNIATPSDLYGKRVTVDPQSTAYAFWVAFTKANNLDMRQITEVTGKGLTPLISGEVDASTALLINEVVTLQQEGYEVNTLNYADFGVKSYGQALLTNETVLNARPDLVRRFTEATIDAWYHSMENVDDSIDALAEAVPETDRDLEKARWTAVLELARYRDGESVPFGIQTLKGWQETYATIQNGGVLVNEFDPSTIYTTEFLNLLS